MPDCRLDKGSRPGSMTSRRAEGAQIVAFEGWRWERTRGGLGPQAYRLIRVRSLVCGPTWLALDHQEPR